ncbi:peptidoglycan DD-metalloendopeptidase family protein [Streptomyces sp. NBC_01212]|uniref:peptidoglycan DD-metalloendopeptidase family protein n=1 Tax=Streptomyces sp. NBC_01212 TaxID=2903775 RepID=UPI002E12A1AA|nr:peptidoglycan DD-metalloendopeptidase family protein [Streptomyces sp. NBC_01212]
MPDLDIVGGAAVDVVPVIPQFHNKLKALVLPIADKVGEEAGRKMGDAISRNIVISIPDAIVQGGRAGVRAAGKQGDDAGGAFARSIRRKLEAAFKAMPKLDVKLGDTGVDAELARIRAKLEQLSNKRIGIDVSAEAAEAEVTRLEEQLRRLGALHPNVAVRADTATARAALAEIRAEISALTATPGRIRFETDGALGARMRAAVKEAQASLPEINVTADTSDARVEIQRIRDQLAALSDQRVGIDISAAEALATIDRLQMRLRVLSMQRHDIDVRVDAQRAEAQLAALRAMTDDTKVFRIKALADTSGASRALLALTIQAAALVAIPIGPALTAGLGAVVSMASVAAAGVGAVALVAIPAIKGVAEALKAKTAAEKESTSASDDGARKGVQAAQRALQMAGAQASLASAHRNAAQSIVSASRQVADAERAVQTAIQRAADQRRQSADEMRRAEQSLADAHRRVRDAQESLTDANENAQAAEEGLTRARKDATRALKDLNDQLTDGALDQREAALRVEAATQELARVSAGYEAGTVSQLDFDQAQLSYDRAIQSQKEQGKTYADLLKSANAQRKAGVEGSDAVRAASERLTDAQKAVRDQTEGVVDAQRQVREAAKAVADVQSKAARAQVDAAEDVADAQRGVADAIESAAAAQVSAAESIESAERGVESARLSGIDTTTKAVTKSDEYRKALAKLTPEGRALFNAIAGPSGITVAFKAWSRELQPEVLPLFTRGVDGAKASLPGLTPLVLGAAAGIESLMDKASAQMDTPFWESFKADLAESVQPAVEGFGVAFGNVIKGIAGIIDAFLPHMDGIADHSDRITERFAKWGTSLKGSPDFERFLAYVKDTSPGLAEFIGEVLRACLDTAKALSPLSEAMFDVIGPLFEAISWLATNCPEFIQTLWLMYFAQKAISIGMAAFAGAMFLYEVVMAGAILVTSGFAAALAATGIVPVLMAIVLALGLVVAGVIYAWNNWDWFRESIQAVGSAIKTAAVWIWDNGLKPAFDGIWAGIQAIGSAAVWLWDNALSPVFNFIAEWAPVLVTGLITLFLLPAWLAIQALGKIAVWLWDEAFKPTFQFLSDAALFIWREVLGPVFGWIGDKAKWLYDKAIKPAFREGKKEFDLLADGAKWLWKEVLKPVFGWIADKATWLYDKALKPAFDHIMSAVGSVADSFEDAKDMIKKAWDKIEGIAKKPVKFIMEHVYNGGIVPLWNAVAKVTGADEIKKLDLRNFHTGGIMDGYSPGRDDRVIAVGGGEAIMRPEWTRAVGADRINSWNAAARTGGISGVQKAISSGMPAFADGGIVGWVKDKVSGAADFLSGAFDYLNPGAVFSKAKELATSTMAPILTNPWAKSVAKMPLKILTDMKNMVVGLFAGGAGGGQWAKPVNAAYGTRFGVAGSMWSSGHHTGLDFPAAVGTAIRAVANGRVASTGSSGPYGIHATVSHGGGLSSLYAHMSRLMTSVGDSVKQGQKIGEVGATGNVTGPHLHLEARVNGRAVDPMTYLTGGGGGGNGGSGVARWRSVVNQALTLTGNPSSYADLTLRRMNQESGGNPTAVNNWDINAKNGTPSVGLMQVIKPTFEAYAGAMRSSMPKLYGVSTNPLANVYASMRYAKSRYGSLPKAYDRPGGYFNGGFPGLGETAWVGEHGPELVRFLAPSQVYSSSDSASLARSMQSMPAQSGAPTTVNVEARVFVGDREITDIVRTEIVTHSDTTASAIETGRFI